MVVTEDWPICIWEKLLGDQHRFYKLGKSRFIFPLKLSTVSIGRCKQAHFLTGRWWDNSFAKVLEVKISISIYICNT